MTIGLFPMVADILHSWHILALREAKYNCDYLIVLLHCNPIYKNPIQSIAERFIQLSWVKYIDEIIPYENSKKDKDLFLALDYDIYFLWSDYIWKDWPLKKEITELGKTIHFLKRGHNYSSTRIKQLIK